MSTIAVIGPGAIGGTVAFALSGRHAVTITALGSAREVARLGKLTDQDKADLCASFQASVISIVADRTRNAQPALDIHLDVARAGIEAVLDQLLDRRGRALDHLAGGDLIDELARENADGHTGTLQQQAPGSLHAIRVRWDLPGCRR